MKKIFFIFIFICLCSIINAQNNLFTYSDNDIVPSNNSYMYAEESVYGKIDEAIQHPAVKYPFWIDKEITHNSADYKMIDSTNIITDDCYLYEVKFFQHKNEDVESFEGGKIFTRLNIDCKVPITDNNGNITYAPNGNVTYETADEPFVFYNDNMWFQFNYYGFGAYTANTNYDNRLAKDICKKIKLSKDCYAIALRGQRDSIDGPGLTIFVLYKGKAQLVYLNYAIDINEIKEEGDKTTFVLQTPKYDDNGKIIPVISKMTFANGMISLEE